MRFKPDPASATVTGLLVLMVAIGPISTDLYLPALPGIQAAFGADIATTQLTLSVYLVAFALSQLIYGPLSDRFGRRSVVIAGLALYVTASLVCVLAPTMEVLIAARLVQAVGGCSGQVIARAIVRDVHGADGAGRVLARIAAAMGVAPLLGPILGGYLSDAFGWQACFIALSLAGGLAMLGGLLLLQETNQNRDPGATHPGQIMRNLVGFFGDPRYLGFALAAGGSYSGLFSFISGSSFVFIDMLGVPVSVFGYCFAAAVAGFIIGARIAGRWIGGPAAVGLGAAMNLLFGLAMLVPLMLDYQSVATVLIPMVLYMVGMGLVLPHAQAGAIGPYPKKAGAASALFGALQNSMAAGVGVLVGHGLTASPLPMAWGVAGSGAFTLFCYLVLIRRPQSRH